VLIELGVNSRIIRQNGCNTERPMIQLHIVRRKNEHSQ
jgi:hypothetical protein